MGCVAKDEESKTNPKSVQKATQIDFETAILGGGCFWCTEAVRKIAGVKEVVSKLGGKIPNPTYKQICTGLTGHAEVIKIVYDPQKISFEKLLDVFGDAHDPTTLNRQGADVERNTDQLSYLSESQKTAALNWKAKLNGKFDPVVTEIVPAPKFYVAEEYHQDYYDRNPNQGYCNFVIRPKLKKLKLE